MASRVAPPPQNVLGPPPGDVLTPQKATAVSRAIPITPKLGAQSRGAREGDTGGDMPRSGAPPWERPVAAKCLSKFGKATWDLRILGQVLLQGGCCLEKPPPNSLLPLRAGHAATEYGTGANGPAV